VRGYRPRMEQISINTLVNAVTAVCAVIIVFKIW
jgi:hypothetical protein